ncbi:hypothetical protein CRM22_007424 [Opisthorchis felineus]|uniref:Amino acid transporter transmembrane domain-containing protein n=2 Tax=Opisthorchis felineus TaxID=147828 RepID=A0A4S2LFY3_OPIFE|nr:hypothetical protein CRM22_007424 [Opisthorchis felineus]
MADDVHQYSSVAGFAFLFNVIMGNGPLTLPAAFQQAGWLLSSVVLVLLCFTSFIPFTFVIEAMSITNAISRLNAHRDTQVDETPDANNSSHQGEDLGHIDSIDAATDSKINPSFYEISEKFELGQMFKIYFGRIGNILLYLNIAIYLYGDLSIYGAGVPKSLRNVVCTAGSNSTSHNDSNVCWDWSPLTRSDVYRIFVACFALCMLPFLFIHLTRSRWLQIFTTAIRWISFILMLCLAVDRAIIIRRDYTMTSLITKRSWNPSLYHLMLPDAAPAVIPHPAIARVQGLPNLFGVCVYVFMCHHSIPGVVTPIRNKRNLMFRIFIPLFFSVLAFNLLLSGTAVAAFDQIQDIYTLNFVPDEDSGELFKIPNILAKIFGYFLSLFPVFALSSTFPILCCTLLGNLSTLFTMFRSFQSETARRVLRWVLPFVVLLPPICIAFTTDNIGFLVGFTGAFAGSGIQYIIPALLVYRARRYITSRLRTDTPTRSSRFDGGGLDTEPLYPTSSDEPLIRNPNCCGAITRLWNSSSHMHIASPFASPFRHFAWILLLVVWSVFCIVVVLVDKICAI